MRHRICCSTVNSNQITEATYMFISRGVDKEDVVRIYNGILLTHKKNEIMPLAAT